MIAPKEAIAHIDTSDKDRGPGGSNCLSFLLKRKYSCEGWQLLGWSYLCLSTRDNQKQSRKNVGNWKMTEQKYHYNLRDLESSLD